MERNSLYECMRRVGEQLRKALLENPAVSSVTTRVMPVASPINQQLPFITYFRSGTEITAVKNQIGSPQMYYQFQIYSEDHRTGAELAEAVVETLHGYTDEHIRICVLSEWAENNDPNIPAFMQIVQFRIKPN